ncbi:MAG: hypothetical protein CVU56_24270 [Deltaproteobacteria bacterium HGW-Deltaproteobacteria-14]|nr:MAG: hypothetical protein CVU56_24270 [Deltaproteobacteria bacterium HGW-Deltaproteobacteria-14]
MTVTPAGMVKTPMPVWTPETTSPSVKVQSWPPRSPPVRVISSGSTQVPVSMEQVLETHWLPPRHGAPFTASGPWTSLAAPPATRTLPKVTVSGPPWLPV